METSITLQSRGRFSFSSDFRNKIIVHFVVQMLGGYQPTHSLRIPQFHDQFLSPFRFTLSQPVAPKQIQNPAQLWSWGTTVDTWRDKGSPGTQICHQCLSEWVFVSLLPLAGWTPHTSSGTYLLSGSCAERRINLASMSGRTRNNGPKLQPRRSRPDIKINFLTARVVKLQKR